MGLGAAAGLGAAFFGVLAGLFQQGPKALLAYSSVSQVGFPTLAVGLVLAEPALWPAGLAAAGACALHHGLAKGALFLGVGVAAARVRGRAARAALAAGLALPGLSLAGAPFTSGAAAKAALKGAVGLAPGPGCSLVPAPGGRGSGGPRRLAHGQATPRPGAGGGPAGCGPGSGPVDGKTFLRAPGQGLTRAPRWRHSFDEGLAARFARAAPGLCAAEARLGLAFLLAALVQFGVCVW